MFGADVSGSDPTMGARMRKSRIGSVRGLENEFSSAIRTLVSLLWVVAGEEGLPRVDNKRFARPAFDGNPGSEGESSGFLRGLYRNRIFGGHIVSERLRRDREKRQCADGTGEKRSGYRSDII